MASSPPSQGPPQASPIPTTNLNSIARFVNTTPAQNLWRPSRPQSPPPAIPCFSAGTVYSATQGIKIIANHEGTMLGTFIKKQGDVFDHWYSLVPGFNTATKEFYESIESELKDRQVPGLEISRVEFAEGGVLSQKREYLRMTRERLVFDICAAPFGTAFFFSCRFAEIPAVIKLWQLLFLLVLSLAITGMTIRFAGLFFGGILLLAGFVFALYILRNAVALGMRDLDASLIKSPLLGPIYERWFRKETYYRHDTRLMYCDTVNSVVKAKVEETCGAKGIKLIRFNEYSPVLGELYKPTTIALPRESI